MRQIDADVVNQVIIFDKDNENMNVAKRGGQVANDARKSYEKQTKKSAISKENALNYKYIDNKKLIEYKKFKKKN